MRLRVGLRQPDGQTVRRVQISADARATAKDVAIAIADTIARHVDEASVTLRVIDPVSQVSRTLDPAATLVESGLVSGSTVELGQATIATRSDRGPSAAVLRVVSGPDRGVEVPLPAGASELGRDPECDVRLTDARVSKHHARILISDKVELIDNNSANGILLGGVREARIIVAPGDVVIAGGTGFTITQSRAQLEAASTDIAFVRSPRVLGRPTESTIDIPKVPVSPPRPAFPWLVMVAPLVMGALLFVFTRSLLSVVFVGLSPILMLGNWVATRTEAKRTRKAERAAFHTRLKVSSEQIERLHDEERSQLLALHPSVAECVQAVSQLDPLVWTRRPEHPEFAQLRLGLGTTASHLRSETHLEEGDPELFAEAVRLAATASVLTAAPVVADLRMVGGVGVCGDARIVDGVARGLVAQIVTLHSPAELTVACVTSVMRRPVWDWLVWLPHVDSAHSPLAGIHLACDSASGRQLVDELEGVVDSRLAGHDIKPMARGPLGDQQECPSPVLPSVIVIVDDPQVDRARLTRLAEIGPDAGVFVVWIAGQQRFLPASCRTVLDLTAGTEPAVGMVRTGETSRPVSCESLDPQAAERLARRFAPLVDAGEVVDDESDLPRSITMVSLIGRRETDDVDALLERWKENRSLVDRTPGRSASPVDHPCDLRAVVGHTGDGPMVLDLRRNGPHALVGGTTGSGKSEFLQAWVLGLAHDLSPDKVTFLFVDYKGGSAFARCVDLPHSVGLVTDLNQYLVRRALTSLRAELRYREHLLQKKGKKDLIDLELTGDPDCPPSLVIVVDEFAALATEVPEFVDGMVDVAQRGRSLGLHLILATQRPAGVIKDNLRSNTNLRVALRMADEQDSVDVLETPEAAHFSPDIPGRAAAKLGPGRIATFQSAYPGARTAGEAQAGPIEISELGFGQPRAWKIPRRVVAAADVSPDIERIVSTVRDAATRAEVPAPRRPWLPALADTYDLKGLHQRRDTEIVLGVRDDPEHQAQVAEYFHPEVDGNILYIGAGGSGKTTALRSLACAASITPRSGPVHIYGLDFAGGGLAMLEDLPNVGSIVPGDDEERVARLLRYLSSLVEERSARYSALRASTLQEYRAQHDSPQEPRLLLLLDGFGAFRDSYESALGTRNPYALFSRLVIDGRAVGLHVAMTADRPGAVPMSISSGFPRRIVLRQADEDSYAILGLPHDVITAASTPGRAMQAHNPQELQLAILGADISTSEQGRQIARLAAQVARWIPVRPVPVRSLPSVILGSSMPSQVGGRPVLGVDDETLSPIGFDPSGPILVTGPAQSGRSNATRWLAASVRAARPNVPLYHLAARRSPLTALPLWRASAVGMDRMAEMITQLKPVLERPADEIGVVGVVVEGLPDLVGTDIEYPLTEILQLCRRGGHLVIADGETAGWSSSWQLLNEVRNARCGLLLQPDQPDGDAVLRVSLPRGRRSDFPPGRGYWIRSGVVMKVQMPLIE